MKPIVKAFLPIAMIACTVCAVSAQQTPTVDQVLARYVTALGGREAILKITSRHVKGTVTLEGIPGQGTAESFAKAPNKYVAVISFEGIGESRRGYDGANGWARDPKGTVVDLSGADLGSLARSADMYQALDIQKNYPKLTLKPSETVDGKPANVLEGDPGDGGIRTMYFDAATGLLVRSVERTGEASGNAVITTDVQDYQDVDGVKYPFTLVQHSATPDGTTVALTIHLSEVHHNVPIDDATFAKPAVKD